MTSFQDAPDKWMEGDKAMEERSSTTHYKFLVNIVNDQILWPDIHCDIVISYCSHISFILATELFIHLIYITISPVTFVQIRAEYEKD